MRLERVRIEGYRSINEPLEAVIDRHVTVLLGANDHGKSNFLEALLHLNRGHGFEDDDLNWDQPDKKNFPSITFDLVLSDEERAELARLETAERRRALADQALEKQRERLAEVEDSLGKAKKSSSDAQSALDQATEHVQEAEEALAANPDDRDAKQRVADAKTDQGRASVNARTASESVRSEEANVEGATLSTALARARKLQATALRQGEPLDPVVSNAAEEAQAEAEDAQRAETEAEEALATAEKALSENADPTEQERLSQEVEKKRKGHTSARRQALSRSRRAANLRQSADALERISAGDSTAAALDVPAVPDLDGRKFPETIVVQRIGLAGDLEATAGDGEAVSSTTLTQLLEQHLPEVRLIEPVEKLPDDVSLTQIEQDSYAFMRGIFEYAGLEPSEWEETFTQTLQTRMRLLNASAQLNETLRASWKQGSELEFSLAHDSKRSKINLEIKDPAVESTFTRPSRRSSGFTHFFALKTILHAYEEESPARSFIWLFDEPGLHLHPDGQRDLIQVMETLGQTNQVIYSTHSIFLANQNYPTRHRLLIRGGRGTTLDSKPFLSRWRTALEALGLAMSGTVLFAPHVLLVEGDSDAILINALLRRLIAQGRLDIDLNSFAAIPTGDPANANALIRILTEAGGTTDYPRIAMLVDGDQGGQQRLKFTEKVRKEQGLPYKKLSPNGTTTEDHVPAARRLYGEAVVRYLSQMEGLATTTREKLTQSYEHAFPGQSEAVTGLADWSRQEARVIAGLETKPSPVGVARAYADLLEEDDEVKSAELSRAVRLGDWIRDALEIPGQILTQEKIEEGPPAN